MDEWFINGESLSSIYVQCWKLQEPHKRDAFFPISLLFAQFLFFSFNKVNRIHENHSSCLPHSEWKMKREKNRMWIERTSSKPYRELSSSMILWIYLEMRYRCCRAAAVTAAASLSDEYGYWILYRSRLMRKLVQI